MLKGEGADLYLFLGDLCGYYFDQEEIFTELLNIPNLIALRGNHDQILLEISRGDEILRQNYLEKFGRSMEYLLEKDCHDMILWLSELPGSSLQLPGEMIAAHGSPRDPMDGYIYPDTSLDIFLEESSDFFLLGHTHYPMDRRIGKKRIVNPGSLGQPRNGGWPSYAVIDLPSGSVVFREIRYEKKNFLQQIEKIDRDNEYLREILFRHD